MLLPVVRAFIGMMGLFDRFAERAELDVDVEFPVPDFALAEKHASGGRRPQVIAHRGFKAKFPENTMAAFRGAIGVGAQALETDVQLTKDGVVVLSHDPNLKRCFGRDVKVGDCTWEQLRTLRTLSAPHEPLPRLADVLDYLAQPGREHVWLLLDIKLENDADAIMRALAGAIAAAPAPAAARPWAARIVLGCWAASYLPRCAQHLAGFPVAYIGASVGYARQLLAAPSTAFNLQHTALMAPRPRPFMRAAKAQRRAIFAWTVNEPARMRWCIRKGVDGVITDDPERFVAVRREWSEASGNGLVWKDYVQVALLGAFLMLFSIWLQWELFRRGPLVRRK